MEGNNSHKIPSGFIWRYSICSLGSPPDESHHPGNDSEGSRFNPRRWQNAVWKSHITVMWKTWEERLQTQTTGTCSGGREPAARAQPAAEHREQGFMKLPSISLRNPWSKQRKAIWKRNAITAGNIRSSGSRNGGSLQPVDYRGEAQTSCTSCRQTQNPTFEFQIRTKWNIQKLTLQDRWWGVRKELQHSIKLILNNQWKHDLKDKHYSLLSKVNPRLHIDPGVHGWLWKPVKEILLQATHNSAVSSLHLSENTAAHFQRLSSPTYGR